MNKKFIITSLFIFFLINSAEATLNTLSRNGIDQARWEEFRSIVKHYEGQIAEEPNNIRLILAVAEVYYAMRDYPQAIFYYKKALELDPSDAKIELMLAQSYLNNKDFSRSRVIFEKLNDSDPNNPEVLAGLGRLQLDFGHYEASQEYFEKSLKIDPENVTTLFYLADLKARQKKYVEAEKILANLLEKNPGALWIDQAYERVLQAPALDEVEKLEKEGNYAAAERFLRSLIVVDRENPDFYLTLARIYLRSGLPNDAIKVIKEGIKYTPDTSQMEVSLGYAYLEKKDIESAEAIFKNLQDKGVNSADVLAGFGRLEYLRGDNVKSEQYYEWALGMSPGNQTALSFLAELRVKEGRYDEAVELYDQIYKIDPSARWAIVASQEAALKPTYEQIKRKIEEKDYIGVEKIYRGALDRYPGNEALLSRFAHFYIGQRQYNKAVDLYLAALKQNPQSVDFLVELGNVYLLKGDLTEARESFLEVLKSAPSNGDGMTGLGRVLYALGDEFGAEEMYQLALKLDPGNTTTLSYYADLEMNRKNYSKAKKLLKKLETLLPEEGWVKQTLRRLQFGPMLEEIEKLEKKGDVVGAILLYEQLLSVSPGNTEATVGLAQLYVDRKNYGEAIKVYESGLRLDPVSIPLRLGLAFANISAGNVSEARRLFDAVLTVDPVNGEALAGLGRIALIRGDEAKAERYFKKAVQENPDDILVLSYYGNYLLGRKEYSKAEKQFVKIHQLNPEALWVESLIEKARMGPELARIKSREQARDKQGVEALYRKLIANQPHKEERYYMFGKYLEGVKLYPEAIKVYVEGLVAVPGSLALRNALGFAYLKSGEIEKGKAEFNQVIKEQKGNLEAMSGLGKVAEIGGDKKQAEGIYRKVLESDPTNLTALNFLANLKFEQGEFDGAQKLYKKILRLDPDSTWVRQSILDAKNGRILSAIKQKEAAEDYEGAEKLYQQLLAASPEVVNYYIKAGLFYNYNKKYQKAVDTYLRGLEIAPQSSELYGVLGLAYLSKKDSVKARHAFEMALKFNNANADALAGMGSVELLDKHFDSADRYIEAALAVDPVNSAGLSSLGNLRMEQQNYPAAAEAYGKLMKLRPKDKWIKRLYENAVNGNEIDAIKQLIEEERFSEAAERYARLTTLYPDNPLYSFGLVNTYVRLRMYSQAIRVFAEALRRNPEENELRVSLGFAYMLNKDLSNAARVFAQAYRIDPKNAELLAGIGQLNVLQEMPCEAESAFLLSLEISPTNITALSSYSNLLIKQKRYDEALVRLYRLQELLPQAQWVWHAIKDAEDGPIMDYAICLSNQQYYEEAALFFEWLVYSSPDDPARYQPMGQAYVDMRQYEKGICIFKRGLEVDPEASFLWRSIGFALIEMNDYNSSYCIFMYLLGEDPEDADSWAGLGRIETLNGSICRAEEYFAVALGINPESVTALAYAADMKKQELYNFSGLQLYANLMAIDNQPKWVRTGYRSFLDLTCPTIHGAAAYHQEIQWDPTVDRWSAQYEVYGASALVNYPVCDELSLWGQVADQFYILKDLLGHFNIYSFDVQRVYIGGRWVYSPCFYIDVRAGLTNFSPYDRCTSFNMMSGTIAEPSLTLTYHEPTRSASLSFSSDADLVARDFSTNLAKLVGRYIIAGTYSQEIVKRGWLNLEGDLYWYRDFVDNTSQRAAMSFQWRPPKYYDYVLLSYFGKYQRFEKNIPDYYTYKYQYINQLQIKLERDWRVCWADYLYASISYGHGWQDTRTRYPQNIVVTPPGVLPPYVWDRRNYNIFNGNMIYRRDQFQLTLTGDYYRDTEKYTMWTLGVDIRWRF